MIFMLDPSTKAQGQVLWFDKLTIPRTIPSEVEGNSLKIYLYKDIFVVYNKRLLK